MADHEPETDAPGEGEASSSQSSSSEQQERGLEEAPSPTEGSQAAKNGGPTDVLPEERP